MVVKVACPAANVHHAVAGYPVSLENPAHRLQDSIVADAKAFPGAGLYAGTQLNVHDRLPASITLCESALRFSIFAPGSESCLARAAPACPRPARNSADPIKRSKDSANKATFPGCTRIPQDASIISCAPPIAVVTTGLPAQSASMNTM